MASGPVAGTAAAAGVGATAAAPLGAAAAGDAADVADAGGGAPGGVGAGAAAAGASSGGSTGSTGGYSINGESAGSVRADPSTSSGMNEGGAAQPDSHSAASTATTRQGMPHRPPATVATGGDGAARGIGTVSDPVSPTAAASGSQRRKCAPLV